MSWLIFSVKGIVLSDGNILLLKRSSSDRYCPGYWELPGGKMETLSFKKEVARELREETNLSLTGGWRFQGFFVKKSMFYSTILGWPTLCFTLFARVFCTEREIHLSHEHKEFGWFDPEFAKSLLLTPETEYALEKYVL